MAPGGKGRNVGVPHDGLQQVLQSKMTSAEYIDYHEVGPVDGPKIVAHAELLLEIREKIGKTLVQVPTQNSLLAVAESNQKEWCMNKLEMFVWSRQRAKSLRLMLRHLDQALMKVKANSKPRSDSWLAAFTATASPLAVETEKKRGWQM